MVKADSKKKRERFFLDKMIRQLNWEPRDVQEGTEPPDFFLELKQGRCAVEITEILHGEIPKRGSPKRAQEAADENFVRGLRDAYFLDPSAQPIQVSAILPLVVRSPADFFSILLCKSCAVARATQPTWLLIDSHKRSAPVPDGRQKT